MSGTSKTVMKVTVKNIAEHNGVTVDFINQLVADGMTKELHYMRNPFMQRDVVITHLANDLQFYKKNKIPQINKPNYKQGGNLSNTPAGGVIVVNHNGTQHVTNDGSQGGIFKGQRHSGGGIKGIVDNAQQVEVETDEALIVPAAVNSNTSHNFNGRQMTPKEILSEINTNAGGVPIKVRGGDIGNDGFTGPDNTGALKLKGSSVIITRNAVLNTEKNDFNGEMLTNHEILSRINVAGGGASFANGGEIPSKIHTTGKQYNFNGKTETDDEIVHECGCNATLKNGGQLFRLYDNEYNIEKAYDLIKSGIIEYEIKEVPTFASSTGGHNWLFNSEFSKNLHPDFNVAQGLMVKYPDNDTDLLIDGNHRMNNAFINGHKTIKVYYISNPKTIQRFSKKVKFEAGGTVKKDLKNWDFEFTTNTKPNGIKFSDKFIAEISVFADNKTYVEFTDGTNFQPNMSQTIGLLSITDNDVKVSVQDGYNINQIINEEDKSTARLNKIAKSSGRKVIENPTLSRREKNDFPFLLVKETQFATGGNLHPAVYFNKELKGKKSDEFYNVMYDAADAGPFDGGCVLYAHALQRVIGGQVVVLVRKDDYADHAAVQVGDTFYDFDGPANKSKFIARFNKNEMAHVVDTRLLHKDDLADAIHHDAAAEKKLAAIMKKSFADGGQTDSLQKMNFEAFKNRNLYRYKNPQNVQEWQTHIPYQGGYHTFYSQKETKSEAYEDMYDAYLLNKNVFADGGQIFARGGYFGGNSGYVGFSMSKRAMEAYDAGKLTYSKLPGWAKKMVDAGLATTDEWHHTSSYGNKTPFYSVSQFNIFTDEEKKELGINDWDESIEDFKAVPKNAIKLIDFKAKEVLKSKNNIKDVRKKHIENASQKLNDFNAQFDSFTRESKSPQHAIITSTEMSGKYGWFNSSSKSYNLPEYYSGIDYKTDENRKKAISLEAQLNTAQYKPIYEIELLKKGFDEVEIQKMNSLGVIIAEIMPEHFYEKLEKNIDIIKLQLKELSALPKAKDQFSTSFNKSHDDFLNEQEKQARQFRHTLISEQGENFGSSYERREAHQDNDNEYRNIAAERYNKAREEFLKTDEVKIQEQKFNHDKLKAQEISDNLISLFNEKESPSEEGLESKSQFVNQVTNIGNASDNKKLFADGGQMNSTINSNAIVPPKPIEFIYNDEDGQYKEKFYWADSISNAGNYKTVYKNKYVANSGYNVIGMVSLKCMEELCDIQEDFGSLEEQNKDKDFWINGWPITSWNDIARQLIEQNYRADIPSNYIKYRFTQESGKFYESTEDNSKNYDIAKNELIAKDMANKVLALIDFDKAIEANAKFGWGKDVNWAKLSINYAYKAHKSMNSVETLMIPTAMVNKKDQVRGTYDIGMKAAIEQIINNPATGNALSGNEIEKITINLKNKYGASS